MTIGGGGPGGANNVTNNALADPAAAFQHPTVAATHQSAQAGQQQAQQTLHSSVTASQQASRAAQQTPAGAQPHISASALHHRSQVTPSGASSSSSAAAAAAAALATLNNDLTLDMSIHISPLTLNHHHHHHAHHQHQNPNPYHQTAQPAAYHSHSHTLATQPPQSVHPQGGVASQGQASNLSNLFQESHTYYYHHHHQGSNSGYQYAAAAAATKSAADPSNQCQQYSFGYYSAGNPNSVSSNPMSATGSGQQSVIYPADYSSMSRLHPQTPSSNSNVATAAHIFSSLYSLAGQAGN